MNSDLFRSYQQYHWQQENGFLPLALRTKIGLILIFIIMLVSALFPRKKTSSHTTAIINYGESDALRPVYTTLSFPTISNHTLRKTFPILPYVFLQDMIQMWRSDWKFVVKNLPFLGILGLRCGQYYSIIHKQQIKNLIVMQEYSYYMSYLTRLLEHEEKHLFNIMHGIPGKEACYFRFTRCFVWGEYFKHYYITNHADPHQFIISGSIYHRMLKKLPPIESTIDVLYMMQGDEEFVIPSQERLETFEILEKISKKFTVACKRHPQYPNQSVPYNLRVVEGSATELIRISKIILSHHSTSLLDGMILGKHVLAFIKQNRKPMLQFLPDNNIVTTKESLYRSISTYLETLFTPSEISYALDDIDAHTVIINTLKEFEE